MSRIMRGIIAVACALAAVVVIGSVAGSAGRTSAAWQDQVKYSAAVGAGPNWVSTTCTPTTSVTAPTANGGATLPGNTRAVKISNLNIAVCVDTDTITKISVPGDGSSITLTMAGSSSTRRVGALTVSGLAAGTWSVSADNAVQRRIVQPPASASPSLPPLHTGWVTATGSSYTLKLATATALSGIPSPWVQYTFASASGGTVPDVSGNNNPLTLSGNLGSLLPIARLTTAGGGSALDVNGANGGFATVPSGLLQNATKLSFSVDVQISQAVSWQRIFDFGSDSTTNMFLTTQGRNGNLQFAITVNGNPGESVLATNYSFPTNQWVNVKLTLQPNLDATTTGVLYVNGTEVGRNSAMLVAPSDLGATANDYIGKSQYSDPYLRGWLDNIVISGTLG